MPVLELPTRDQHEWEFGVRAFGCGNDVGRNELARPLGVGKRSVNTTGSPGVAFLLARIGDRALGFSRSHVMPAIEGIALRISLKTSAGPA